MAEKVDFILKNRKIIAAMGTMFFCLLLLWIFIFIVFRTSIPPFPDEGGGGGGLGIEVNLGNSNEGMGIIQSDQINTPEFSKPVVTESSKEKSEKLITQESNDESTIIKNDNNKNSKKNTVIAKNENKKKKDENKETELNPNADFSKWKKNKGGNQGETGKPGDQGKPGGTIYSKNYKGDGGGGNGTGPGKGGGIGNGEGNGIGSGKGHGVSYKLEGRTKKYLPEPKYDIQESGVVTVEIVVNREGKVIRVRASSKGTTTTNATLWKRAEEAALKTTFSSKPDAPEEQKGSITYHFILN
ncbi:MAG: energy transducer TonB [Bacteroidales bacterium]|jgi:TonB family protein